MRLLSVSAGSSVTLVLALLPPSLFVTLVEQQAVLRALHKGTAVPISARGLPVLPRCVGQGVLRTGQGTGRGRGRSSSVAWRTPYGRGYSGSSNSVCASRPQTPQHRRCTPQRCEPRPRPRPAVVPSRTSARPAATDPRRPLGKTARENHIPI